MKAVHLYTDSKGFSAFREIELATEKIGVERQRTLPVSSELLFNQTDAGHSYPWHNAPRRQWVITLTGEIEVSLKNGTSRRFCPGEVILADDLTGSGHATRVVSTEPWRCVYLPFEGKVDNW